MAVVVVVVGTRRWLNKLLVLEFPPDLRYWVRVCVYVRGLVVCSLAER